MHLDISQGLSNSSVNCFYQDYLGFMWIGTDDGLNKYDGLKFEIFRNNLDKSSLDNNKVNCIFEDSQHHLLIGTNQGINVFDRIANTFKSYPIKAPVNVIFEDSRHNIWFGTDHGQLHLFDIHNLKSIIFFNNEEHANLSSNAINAMAEDSQGNLFIARGGTGLNEFNIDTKKFTTTFKQDRQKKGLSDNYIQSLLFDKQSNSLWMATNKGLDQYNLNSKQIYNYKDKHLRHLYTLIQYSKEKLWIGTELDGSFFFTIKDGVFQRVLSDPLNANSLSNNQIRKIYQDRQGNTWIGCYRGGINLLTASKNFNVYRFSPLEKNKLNNNTVLSVLTDKNKNLWIGTDGGGLNFLDRSTGRFTFYTKENRSGLQSNSVAALFEDQQGKIWIGTASGLCIMNPVTKSITCFKDPDSLYFRGANDIRAITGDGEGNIWVASNGNGISKFSLNGQRLLNYRTDWQDRNHSLVTNWTRCLQIDKKGKIWIGSVSGISLLDPFNNHFENFYADSLDRYSRSEMVVNSLFEDSKGAIWAGTTMGIKKINPKTKSFQTLSTHDGLPNNIVNGVVEDAKGYLWISTNNGLSKFREGEQKITNYDVSDGLAGNGFISNAYFKGLDGTVYFGSTDGLIYFDPKTISADPTIPDILLTDFRIFNKSIQPGTKEGILKEDINLAKEIEINYDQSFFALEFAAPYYTNQKKIYYKYILEGFDKDWVYSNAGNVATYTNIEPGSYVFKASNSIGNGMWNARPATITIIVHPPIWKTPLAYVFYLIMIALVLFLLRRFTINREKLRNALYNEKVKNEKVLELNAQKLNFFTNVSHEFKTPLTLILGPIERLLSGEPIEEKRNNYYLLIKRNSERLLKLIDEVLDINRIDAGNLSFHPSEQDIIAFVKNCVQSLNYIAEQNKIQLQVHTNVTRLDVSFDPDKLEKIILNLLGNALKFTNENGTVEVSIREEEQDSTTVVVISFQDNGPGIHPDDMPHIFDRFYKAKKGRSDAEGTGIGLAIVKDMVELHNGRIEVQSTLGVGTAFTVFLPFRKNSSQESFLPSTAESENVVPKTSEWKDESKKIKILLIEDNSDVRAFIRIELSDYTVEEAVNGKKGIEQAFQSIPELIITDIMMPEMNGVEICKILKTDIRTSHIPIIMLTAKSSADNQIEGLETGADAYFTKPFNINVLKLQIRNILNFRETLRKRFIMEPVVDVKEITVTSTDELLLRKAIEIVEKNISNSTFGVNDFAAEIGIGRTLFYTKIKQITGQTVNDFIQTIRLKRAANLLLKTSLNISEISYDVGFNSPQYFTKAFKAMFNTLPTQYREDRRNTIL
jgi:signal transduction histidine kinase/ligand-binding sensor domain-containing protein/AraC-like DNA-binding protein